MPTAKPRPKSRPRAKAKVADDGAAAAPPAQIDPFVTVIYDTTSYGPPHTVTLRHSANGWEDLPMTCVEADGRAIWSANVKGSGGVEFKLVLDGQRWMAGANQWATAAAPPAVARYDESTVFWEG